MEVRPYSQLSRVYDAGWPGLTDRYIPFVGRLLEGESSRKVRVLDIACGTGEFALALARAGHAVHGIDLSPEMIALAREKAAGIRDVTFAICDMRALACEAAFGLVTCTFDSINYLLDPDDLRATFEGVARCLVPSGAFVFDSNADAHYASRSPLVKEAEWDGERLEHRMEYDPTLHEVRVTFSFPGGVVEVHRQRPYDLETLSPLLGESGLRVAEAYSDLEGHEYIPGSERVVCVARHGHDCMASN